MLPSGNLREGYTIYRSDNFAGICVCARAFVPALVYTQPFICAVLYIYFL
jgi:hypothetical protein